MNFISSISIIWANKVVYNSGFPFPVTITIIHFFVTWLGLVITHRHSSIRVADVLPISIAFCGFVVLNNISLQLNTIGTYQLLKVLTTPTIVIVQRAVYGVKISGWKIASLVPVCTGVVLATCDSVNLNIRGVICGLAAVLVTSIYQIWVKTEQQRLMCSSEELLMYQAPVSAGILACILPWLGEWANLEIVHPRDNWTIIAYLAVSALLALFVNISIFIVIKKTSPVTYNVLGHGKLIVILISGYVLFGDPMTIRNGIGTCMTVIGIMWYTKLTAEAHPNGGMRSNVVEKSLKSDQTVLRE